MKNEVRQIRHNTENKYVEICPTNFANSSNGKYVPDYLNLLLIPLIFVISSCNGSADQVELFFRNCYRLSCFLIKDEVIA